MSNTKLSPAAKALLMRLREGYPDAKIVFSGHETLFTGVTACTYKEFPGAKMMFLSISIASLKEAKYRKKVGEYTARLRMDDRNYITVPCDFNVQNFIDEITLYRTL